jgi:hypothetical protein
VGPAAHVQGPAVGQKWQTAQTPDFVSHSLGKIGAQKGQVARFSKMDLYGHELALKIQGGDSGLVQKPGELLEQTVAKFAPHVGKKHISFGH